MAGHTPSRLRNLSLPVLEIRRIPLIAEIHRTRRTMEDPEAFLEDLSGQQVILDEIHRLARASQLLKIAADHSPDVRIVATGSSTQGDFGQVQGHALTVG